MYNSAEAIAYELAHLRLIDEARRAQLEVRLLDLVAGREGGHKGRRGFWLPEDQGFTRSADKAVEAWRKYARAQS